MHGVFCLLQHVSKPSNATQPLPHHPSHASCKAPRSVHVPGRGKTGPFASGLHYQAAKLGQLLQENYNTFSHWANPSPSAAGSWQLQRKAKTIRSGIPANLFRIYKMRVKFCQTSFLSQWNYWTQFRVIPTTSFPLFSAREKKYKPSKVTSPCTG